MDDTRPRAGCLIAGWIVGALCLVLFLVGGLVYQTSSDGINQSFGAIIAIVALVGLFITCVMGALVASKAARQHPGNRFAQRAATINVFAVTATVVGGLLFLLWA